MWRATPGTPCRHESADLGGHDPSRTHLLDLGGVYIGGALDPARILGGASDDSIEALERFDASMLVLEAVVLAALIASLGRIAVVWLNGWAFLLAVMVLGGIALPLYLRLRGRGARRAIGPALVLLGGLILRAVIIFSSDQLT